MNISTIRAMLWSFVLQPSNSVMSLSMADDREALNLEPTQTYPQLQLSEPSIRAEVNKGRTWRKTYGFEVAIVAPAATDDFAGHRDTLREIETEMERLLSYLNVIRHDFGNVEIVSLGEMVPIRYGQNDSLSGYAMSLSIKTNMDCHHNPDNIYQVVHLAPDWTEGQTELGVNVAGTEYAVPWTDEKQPARQPIDTLVAAITTDFGTHGINARRDLDTLILRQSIPAANITWATVAGKHSWTSITI